MSERRYTISEIDKMRNGIACRFESRPILCSFNGAISKGSQERVDAFWRTVEDQLRTALVAGVDPAEFGNGQSAPGK